jgi:hypothetical protein
VLRFGFERADVAYRGGLRFEKVRAYRHRAEAHCTVWHVEGVYDTLAEISDSEWASELKAADTSRRWEIRHFMIYVDSSGSYEIVAASRSWLQEEQLP